MGVLWGGRQMDKADGTGRQTGAGGPERAPLSSAMRKSRLRCSSFMNSSFCRKRAMRSSSWYCFSFRSCSVAAATGPVPPPGVGRRLTDESEEEDDDDG